MENKTLPDLHRQALLVKNRKRHQHDGGRAWILDGQLHEAVRGANWGIEASSSRSGGLKDAQDEDRERERGKLIARSRTIRKL